MQPRQIYRNHSVGELLHYIEVRQHIAGLEGALLFDETDHLGAYIAKHRFDVDIRELLKKGDQVIWEGSGFSMTAFCETTDLRRARISANISIGSLLHSQIIRGAGFNLPRTRPCNFGFSLKETSLTRTRYKIRRNLGASPSALQI